MYVGIDIGTGSLKAAFDWKGGIEIVKHTYPQEMLNRTVHRADFFKEHLKKLCRDLSALSRERGEPIQGIAVDGHGPSIMLVDGEGSPISDVVTWQDTKASSLEGKLREKGIGRSKMELGYETKALWLYRRYVERKGLKEALILSPKDYLIFLLTGERVIDRASADTILFYDKVEGKRFAEIAGIPFSLLPEVVEPWEVAGVTGTSCSRAAGLQDGIPIYGGGPDAWCEALGAGASHSGEVVEGTGTSTCITVCRERGDGMNYHLVPDMDMDIETLSSTGRSLLWAVQLSGEEASVLDELDLSKPVPILFLPYLTGERSPVWDPQASGAFVGLKDSTSKAEVIRSAVQGVSFAIRQNLERMAEKKPIDKVIRAVGGANASNTWLQQKANLTGHTYYRMELLDSAPFGSWMLAAFGSGEAELKELSQRYNKIAVELIPEKPMDESFEMIYREYTRLYEILKPVMHGLAEIPHEEGRGA